MICFGTSLSSFFSLGQGANGRHLDGHASVGRVEHANRRVEVLLGELCRQKLCELASKDKGAALQEGHICDCEQPGKVRSALHIGRLMGSR